MLLLSSRYTTNINKRSYQRRVLLRIILCRLNNFFYSMSCCRTNMNYLLWFLLVEFSSSYQNFIHHFMYNNTSLSVLAQTIQYFSLFYQNSRTWRKMKIFPFWLSLGIMWTRICNCQYMSDWISHSCKSKNTCVECKCSSLIYKHFFVHNYTF